MIYNAKDNLYLFKDNLLYITQRIKKRFQEVQKKPSDLEGHIRHHSFNTPGKSGFSTSESTSDWLKK